MKDQEEISAVVTPIPGIENVERIVSSMLVGLGFRVWHGVLGMTVSAPPEVWEKVFGLPGGADKEIEVPDELKTHVESVVLKRS